MTTLSSAGSLQALAKNYRQDGYVFPVDALSVDEAMGHRQNLEALEARFGDEKFGNRTQLNYPHVLFRFAYDLICNPKILDVVEAILGPDILVWGSTLFIKEPKTKSFVSWHQDLRYWGLDNDEEVSAWIALGPVSENNGCMRFVPGSHVHDLLPHNDTFDEDNVLTRGQRAAIDIDEAATVPVELAAGQVSFHHGRLLHASGPNYSDERRIGMAINYISTKTRQIIGSDDYAMLVRGEDRFRHFKLVPPPQHDLSPGAIKWHHKILNAQNEAMYDGIAEAQSASRA